MYLTRDALILSFLLTSPCLAQTAGSFSAGKGISSSGMDTALGGKVDVNNGSLVNPTITGGTLTGVTISTSPNTMSLSACPGVVGDGVANDTNAVTNCLSSLSAHGGTLTVPDARKYLLDPIVMPAHVCLQGERTGPFDGGFNPQTNVNAPTLIINSYASTFLSAGFDTCIQDLLFYDPAQVSPTATTPTAHPAMITVPTSTGGAVTIQRNTLVNAYAGINNLAGKVYIDKNKIGAYSYAISVDNAADWVFVRGNLIEPFYETYLGLGFPQTVDTWALTNGNGMVLRRVDEIIAEGNGIFGKNKCVLMDDTINGATGFTAGYGTLSNITCDIVSHGFYAKSTNNVGAGYQIINPSLSGNSSGHGIAAVAAFETVAGGTETPLLTVQGGFLNNSWSATKAISQGAGQIIVRNHQGINPFGPVTAPTVPATGVGFVNTFSADMRVFIAPGSATISVIGINATPTGLTSGMFNVLVGETITIVYSGGTPTWTWFGA